MAIITSENRDAWQDLANKLAPQFPSVGKRVCVVSGRNHLNVEGIVFWHGRDKFASTQFKTSAQLMLRDMEGRRGFRIGIKTNDGEKFFVSADCVEVLCEEKGKNHVDSKAS